MTGRATFGDFAGAARTYLDHAMLSAGPAARRWETAARTRQTEAFTVSLRAVMEVMARYLADITAPVAGVSGRDRALLSTWAKAGICGRGFGGKYVPPKNGRPSGVRKTLMGQPPEPVSDWTASM